MKTFKISQPDRVGLLNDDAMSPRRRSSADAMVRHGFRCGFPDFENKLKTYLEQWIHATVRLKRGGPSMYPSVNVVE